MTAATGRPRGRDRWGGVLAVARYEYLMQVRRPAVWIALLLLIALAATGPGNLGAHPSTADLLAGWAVTFNTFAPLGVGVLLADRALRERKLRLDDLLDSTAARPGPRWWGKALGAATATVTPIIAAWTVLMVAVAIGRGPVAIPIGIAAFATVNVPGLAFVAAASLTLPLLIGTPLFRAGFVGYWFWGNLLNERRLPIPTPAGTPFEAIGEYPSRAWFGGKVFEAFSRGIRPDTLLALVSIGFLLLTAAAVLAAGPPLIARGRRA
jgi:hypothetical protein